MIKRIADVQRNLMDYLVNRRVDALEESTRLIQEEIDDPQLQECKLTIDKMTSHEVDHTIFDMGFLKLSVQDVTNDGDIIVGDYCRVYATDQEEGTVMILRIVNLDDSHIILVPHNEAAQ